MGRGWSMLSTSSPTGDILLNVNGVDLTGVTRGEAVTNLKNTSSPVVLKVLEMRPPEESLQECALPPCLTPSPTDSTKSPLPNDDYSPLWVSWLQLPRWAPLDDSVSTQYPFFYFLHYFFSEPSIMYTPHTGPCDLCQLVPTKILTEPAGERKLIILSN